MWFRRTPLPDDVRRVLGLDPRDRVLAAAGLADGSWAVATKAELVMVDRAGAVRRAAWCDVDRAVFEPASSVLTLDLVDAGAPLRLPVTDADRTALPQVVRERVQWSVVLAETVSLPGGRQAKVAVRRTPQGGLFSQAVAGPGVDLDDPSVAPLVDAAEARVRGASGLPL